MDISEILKKNLFINDLARSVVCWKYNKEIIQFTNEISNVDSIMNFDEFSKSLAKIPKQMGGSSYTIKRAFAENTWYGYCEEVMRYAGIDVKEILYMPLLEHGISLNNALPMDRYNLHSSYIFQGRSHDAEWREKTDKKAYYIGPYVHYARYIYSEKNIQKLKKKLGKVLLVFPAHSTEYEEVKLKTNDFNDYMLNQLGKDYDTILCCLFWKDCNSEYAKYLKEQGTTLVSCGFKTDSKFVRRLKTLIRISDTVLFPSFSTSIGFAYYMKKNIIYFSQEANIQRDYNKYAGNLDEIDNIFINGTSEFNKAFRPNSTASEDDKIKLINFYWGLDQIKTPIEIKALFNDNKKDIIKHLGF